MRPVLAITCALVALAAAAAAHADPAPDATATPPSRADDPRAHADWLFAQGNDFYASQEYVAAALLFEEAHRAYGALDAPDAAAVQRRQEALFLEVSAYSLAAQPVEASAALARFRDLFAGALTPTERERVDTSLAAFEARIGALALHTDAGLTGVIALIDGKVVDPAAPIRLAAGEHQLELRADEHRPLLRTITIEGGKPLDLPVALDPDKTPARVRFEATADGAQVAVDGKAAGLAPVELTLPPGPHAYDVTAPAHLPAHGELTVEPGERAVVRAALVVRRAPLGLRIEPYLLGLGYLRTDTPYGSSSAGVGARVFTSALRVRDVRFGLAFEYDGRDLGSVAAGGVAQWCPDALSTEGAAADALALAWCPANVDLHATFGGHADPAFTPGPFDGRVSTAAELRTGASFFRFAVGLGLVTYKSFVFTDSPDTLVLTAVTFEVSAGLDL